MKTKSLLAGLIILVAGALWAGWSFWRAHRGLVTLNVREMPLAEVLQKIERQTGTKIRAEQSLESARITLHVKDKPLQFVLDRVGGQAGAHWSTIYAVYDSAPALRSLDAALAGDGQLDSAGWTKIAPSTQVAPKPAGSVPNSSGPRGHVMMFRNTPNGPVVFEGGPGGKMQEWSPSELVAQSALLPRLGEETNQLPTAAGAAAAAQKVNGGWTTYFAFSKSLGGADFARMTAMHLNEGARPRASLGDTSGFIQMRSAPTNATFAPPPLNPNDRYANLTPEERVQQARSRAQFKNSQSPNHIQFLPPP